MPIHTVAVFHCQASAIPASAWCCADGIVKTLAAMGYDVIDCGRPTLREIPIDILRGVDLIIMSGVDWFDQVIAQRYGAAWFDLKAPKVAWYSESAHRDDGDFDYSRVQPLANLHYYPAAQDAVEFAGRWLPFGADVEIFNPKPVEKTYGAAFLGTMYPKRAEYVAALRHPLEVLPLVSDDDPVRSCELLAERYSATRIFVNLPSLSRLLVTKVTEVMACRTLLLTPAIDHPSGAANMDMFESGKHLVYYDPDHPESVGPLIEHYLAHPDEAAAIARAGWEEVRRAHTLRHRLDAMLADVRDFQADPQASQAFRLTSRSPPDRAAEARVLEAEGRLDLASELWAEALVAAPGNEALLDALTTALVKQGRVQDAVAACRRVIEAGSSSSYPHRLAAVISFNHGDAAAAVAWLKACLHLHPEEAELHRLLASIGFQTLDREMARVHGLKAIATGDDHTALAVRRVILADYEGALEIGKRLLAVDPTNVDVLTHCAISHHMLGELEAAIGYYFRAAEHSPYRGDVLYPLADALLLLGDMRAGWRRFETVADEDQILSLHPNAAAHIDRFWRGQELSGRRLLVLNLVGLGDSLMYLRYARQLWEAAAHVTFCCRPELLRLLEGAEGIDALCAAWPMDDLGQYDYWVFDLLLPARLGAADGRIPASPEGYIQPPRGPPRKPLSLPDQTSDRLQVGLCWTAVSTFYSGNTRLIWPEDLRPLSAVRGVDWHVLQKRPREPDFAELSGLELHDVSDEWDDFQDTARFALGLDLTLSICSAPVHLVGALGLPVWAMISNPPEWRWGLRGAQSPWYPQARIFRQAVPGDWLSVTSAIAAALNEERDSLMRRRRERVAAP